MKLFLFAASLRGESLNKKLIAQASQILEAQSGVEVFLADFKEFEIPVYNGDEEDQSGVPVGAKALSEAIASAHAVMISAPEYNGGISGALKNALDWVSRMDQNPFEDKPLLLIGTSPGALGAVRGLWHTRVPLEAMGAWVYPEMFGLPRGAQAFQDDGSFVDPKNAARLRSLLMDFLKFAKRDSV